MYFVMAYLIAPNVNIYIALGLKLEDSQLSPVC